MQSTWDAESHHLSAVGHHDLDGSGDGMQVLREGDALYVGHFGPSGMGTSILDASDPTDLRMVRQIPSPAGSHTHKVQVADGVLLVNHEQFRGGDPYSAGMAVYDLADPFDPRQIGWFDSTGRGVHRIVWTGGRYAHVSAIPDGFNDRIFVVVDLSDPTSPVEAGRWWWPGQWLAGDEEPTWPEGKRYAAHHGLLSGDVAYVGYGDAGLVVLDLTDPTRPAQLGHLDWEPGGDTHTCLPLPGRDLLVVTDEVVDSSTEQHLVRIVDVSDPTRPVLVSHCPVPTGDYATRGLRFGPHNTHENRPGSYRSAELVFVTYFNAGLRVYDVSDPTGPQEIAHWVPRTPAAQQAAQVNDLFVSADLDIYVTDRVNGGVYVVRPDEELATRMRGAALP
ncbi:LVIVD repeat-containing protein [Nocardioides sp.]|uniref:LVIVD repeat-containing protein n=1 Tax=Nocardioides sp. TaxID=35761 RepID=UPI002ED29865